MTDGDPGSDEIFDEVRRSHRDTSCADFEAEKSGNIVETCILVAHARDFFSTVNLMFSSSMVTVVDQWWGLDRRCAMVRHGVVQFCLVHLTKCSKDKQSR